MAEESRKMQKRTKPAALTLQNPSISAMANATTVSRSSSVPSSPVGLTKAKSLRSNCLCSPTTHAGSFRCRYHRNSGITRNSVSVGAKLSELGANMPVAPKLPKTQAS